MGKTSLTLSVALVALSSLSTAPLRAQSGTGAGQAPASADFEAWLGTQHDTRGRSCDKLAVESVGDRYAVACGGAGLWVARRDSAGAFALVRTDDLGGPVVGLVVRDGNVWATLVRTEARPVTLGGEGPASRSFPVDVAATAGAEQLHAPPTKEPPPPSAPPPRNEGHVTRLLPGEVEIDLGRADGIRFGESIELSVLSTEQVGGERALGRNVLSVGEVTTLSPGFSRVKLGIGERVPLGALARVVEEDLTAARAGPPRLGGLWEVGFMARPFIALNDLGGGVLLDASVGYRFESDFHLEAALSPLAYGTGSGKPAVVPVASFLKASYDLPLFEVGAGLGFETVHNVEFGTDSGTGTLFVQQLRLGAADGLKLDLLSHVVLFHSRFQFSGLVGVGQIPVGQRFWLLLRGGGGGSGFAYGEFGVRALLKGNGDRGSLYFTGTVGGLSLFEAITTICSEPGIEFECEQEVRYDGPLLGAGAEWRF